MDPNCAHSTRVDGVCQACGDCLHEIVLNGVCYFCAAVAPKTTVKAPSDIVPAARLRRGDRKADDGN